MPEEGNRISIGCFREVEWLHIWDWEYIAASLDYHIDLYFSGDSNSLKVRTPPEPDEPDNMTYNRTDLRRPQVISDVYDFVIQANKIFDVIIIPLSLPYACSLRIAEHIHILKLKLKTVIMTGSLTASHRNTVPFFDYFDMDSHTIRAIVEDHQLDKPPVRLKRDQVDAFIEYLLYTQHCLSGNATHDDNYPPLDIHGYKRGLTPRNQQSLKEKSIVIHGNVVYDQSKHGGNTMSQDVYNINQAGQVGSNNKSRDMSLNQTIQGAGFDMEKLSADLGVLRAEMKRKAQTLDEDQAVGHVASAEKSAIQGDTKGALSHLKAAGLWALETGKSIGVPVAVAALTHVLGS